VTDAIEEFMYDYGFTRKLLAERMGVTPGRVTQILSGDENLTLRSLATIAAALGAEFHVMLTADGSPGGGRASEPTPDEGGTGCVVDSDEPVRPEVVAFAATFY
jgi:transcriptional regulator with XRE-family HTH domain